MAERNELQWKHFPACCFVHESAWVIDDYGIYTAVNAKRVQIPFPYECDTLLEKISLKWNSITGTDGLRLYIYNRDDLSNATEAWSLMFDSGDRVGVGINVIQIPITNWSINEEKSILIQVRSVINDSWVRFLSIGFQTKIRNL